MTDQPPDQPPDQQSSQQTPPEEPGTDGGDPFMKYARGRYPIATGPSSASAWTRPEDNGVPRPDKTIGWLRLYSTLLGIVGADHFYLRSPWTGVAKALTLGGCLLWWIWDATQVWAEADRVVTYGMTAPFDVITGIGQGMIYDSRDGTSPVYAQRSSYTLWWFGVLLNFLGIDSLVSEQHGRWMRKFFEFAIFASCLSCVLFTSVSVGWFFALLFTLFFGLMVVRDYIISLHALNADPATLMKEGIVMESAAAKQINMYIHKLVSKLNKADDEKEQIKDRLNYGSVAPEYLKKIFAILHPSELKAEIEKEKKEQKENEGAEQSKKISSLESFFWVLFSPFWIVALWLWWLCEVIYYSILGIFNPIAVIIQMVTKKVEPVIDKAKGVAENVLDEAARHSNEIMRKVLREIPMPTIPMAIPQMPTIPQLPLATANPASPFTAAPQLPVEESFQFTNPIQNPLHAPKTAQKGGAKTEQPSSESLILGAVMAALAGGGALKAAIDYLTRE